MLARGPAHRPQSTPSRRRSGRALGVTIALVASLSGCGADPVPPTHGAPVSPGPVTGPAYAVVRWQRAGPLVMTYSGRRALGNGAAFTLSYGALGDGRVLIPYADSCPDHDACLTVTAPGPMLATGQ